MFKSFDSFKDMTGNEDERTEHLEGAETVIVLLIGCSHHEHPQIGRGY